MHGDDFKFIPKRFFIYFILNVSISVCIFIILLNGLKDPKLQGVSAFLAAMFCSYYTFTSIEAINLKYLWKKNDET